MSIVRGCSLAALFVLLCCPSAFSVLTPTGQVQETVDQVVEVLRKQEFQGLARREKLSGLIRSRFDFAIMSQRTLGKYWKQANPAEQEQFVNLYSDLLEASYIGRIEAYTDEKVSYEKETIEEDRAVVSTLIHSGNVAIPIEYRLVLNGEEWFVYDVVVEDISLIKNYRSSYGEIVRKNGFSELFALMREKIKKLHEEPAQTVAN